MSNDLVVSQDAAQRSLKSALRLFVGQGRRYSTKDLAEASGVCQRTIESYRAGDAMPSLERYQSLCSVLGQAFFAATVKHMPFEVRSTEPSDITAPQLLTEMLSFSGLMAGFLEDGRIDHVERAQLKPMLADVRESITAMENILAEESE
ncbi:MAG: helix-turn-helix transcriptional regulator [Pseudomonadota bacterium]